MMSKNNICSSGGSKEGVLMLMPPKLSWHGGNELCRRYASALITELQSFLNILLMPCRFGGRLHIDLSAESVITRSSPVVAHGEILRPSRCARVWLGATDRREEGVWRDSETDEILDIKPFWGPGQPNGVRIQNCAGIWELVCIRFLRSLSLCRVIFLRMEKEVTVMMMEVVKKNGNVPSAHSRLFPVQR